MTYDIFSTQWEEGSSNLSLSHIFPITVFTHKQNIILFFSKLQIFLNMWCLDAFFQRWRGDMSYLKYWNGCIDRNILSGTVTAAGSCTIQLSLDRRGDEGSPQRRVNSEHWTELKLIRNLNISGSARHGEWWNYEYI